MSEDGATEALRTRSPDALLAGLHRLLTEHEQTWLLDWRDLLVALAPYHDCARRLGLDPATVFDTAATAGPPSLADHVRTFGRRTDITPRAFAFTVVDTPDGPAYRATLP